MPARYDDAVEKNKKYLTRAQIKALAEASQRYDAMHAANRAEAQQSMQQQYDSGFRALQNMGLAGSGATSGEVPRLQQQVRTPFDQYNQKLRDVEHQQLGVLAAAYAKQTRRRREAEKRRRAEEAALKAQRDGMKRTAMERARMQQTSEAAALKAQRDGIKRTEMERMRDPSYQAAYKAQMDGIKRTAMEQERAFRESPSYQAALKAQQDGIKRTYQMQARALADSGIISGGTVTLPSQESTPSYAQTQKEYQHAQTAANAINRRTGANVNPMDLAYPGLRMYEPQMPDEAQAEQATTAEERQVKALSDAGFISKMFGRLKPDFNAYLSNQAPIAQSEQAKPSAQGEGSLRVSDESVAAARARLRELALKATKENVPKAELDKAKADVDLAKLKAQYPALSYIGAPEDAEEKYNIIRGEYSRAVDDLSMTLPANAEDPETRNELSRLIKTIDQAREDMSQKYVGYDPSEVLSAAQEDLGKYGISEDQARAYLGMFTENGEMKKPEWFQKVKDELAMAELAYKNPDTYTALQLYPYLHEISDMYPDLAKWATGKVADYNMQQYGFDMPSMTDEEYTAQKKSIKGWKDALRRYDNAAYSYNTAGQAETEDIASDKYNAGQDLDEITKKIKSEYGMTPDELRAAIEKFQQERDARSEYDYYHDGMIAQVEHADEKPEQPVKQYEQDYMYRLVNGLIHEDIQQNAAARFITKEQRDAYNAIYERDGIDAANKYLEDIAPYLNLQRAAKDAEYYEQFAKEHPYWAFLRARGANLAWNIPAFLENVGTGLVGAFTEERPYYDENSLMSYRSKRADYITSTQSQQILNNMNRPQFVNDTLNFMYNSAASAADSAAVMALAYLGAPTAVTSMFFASSAGNEAYRDARERGATQDQALSYAIVSAAAETVFEEVSLEHLMSMDFSGKGALIKNLGSHAFVEGSEELNTGIANALADVWIMKDKSQYNLAKQQYLSEGMTENKAELKAFMDQAKDIGMEAFAGAMSAMLMVPVGKVISEAEYVIRGKKLQSKTADMDRVTRLAELLGGKPMEMLNQYNADPTARNAGAMLATVQKTMKGMFGEEGAQDISKESSFDAAATLPRTPEGALDLDAAKKSKIIDEATAYSAILAGDRMNAGVAESVREILGEKKLAEFGYDASSAAKLAKSYNDRLDKYKIKSYGDTMAQVAPSVAPSIQAQRPGSTLKDYLMRAQDSSFRAENPTYAGGRISGAALQQRQQTRQQVDLKARENSAISRVWKNPSQGYATTSDGRQVMSLPGNMTAVARAEYERKNFKARTTARMDGVTLELSGMEARQGMSNAQIFAEARKSMTKDAARKLDTYMKLSKALSLPMVIRDVVTGTSGYVHDGKLYVTLNGQQSIPRVVAHELTHLMKEATASKYSALRNHLISEVGGKEEFDKLVNEKAQRYGLDLSTEAGRMEADDEVCAELCERMLSDPEALERLAEKNIGAAKTLRDKLLKILNAIKAVLKDVKNRDFGDSKSDLIKQEQTIEAWFDALDDALNHVNERANTTEGQIAQVAGVTTSDQESLIKDVKNAKTEEDIDKAFAEHSVDIIEYDMIGYHQDLMENLVPKGIMSEDEIDDLFSTMIEAVKYVKFHRDILDFGFRLSEEAQNDPELAEKEIQAAKAGRAYLPYKQNADPHYKLALDFSTLCKKRILLQMIQERLQGKLGRALSALETIAVRREIQKLQKNGVNVEVACALCYVEAARLKSPKVINEFLGVGLSAEERAKHVESEMKNYFAQKDKAIAKIIEGEQKEWKVKQLGADWRGTDKKGRTITAEKATKDQLKAFGGQALVDAFNEFSKERRTGERVGKALNSNQKEVIDEAKRLVQQSPKTFLSAESLAQLKKDNPDIFYAFTNKVRSATRSKALETDTFYARGDISMVEEAIVRTANKESGFRHQSWSDFMPIHLLDTMASIIEMSQRDAKMHAYTKVPDMVRLLGKTGMMLNLSLIPKGETGLNADGTLAWDSVEGMAWEVMMELRDAYADTVGNIAIGISDEQIRQLLASDDIDYVIPYHVSGMNKTLRSHMGIHTWLDFTSSQNESEREGKAPSGRTWKEEHKARKMKPPALEAWFKEKDAKAAGKNGVAYMQKAAQDYLDICARDGWVPKFSQYLNYDAKANKYTVKPGYENYWKMLTDRKMVNQKTGEVIIQQAVKPRFDNAVVMDILRSEAEDPTAIRNAAAADEIAGELGKTWRGDKENANLKSYKAELNAFREASAVMAADRVKEDVKRRLAETRNSIDTDYMRIAEKQKNGTLTKEDESKLRKMVDEAAAAAGYTIKAYHGSRAIFTEFSDEMRGSSTKTQASKKWHFAADYETANSYYPAGVMRELIKQNPSWFSQKDLDSMDRRGISGKLYPLYLKMNNPLVVDVAGYDYESHKANKDAMMEYVEQADREGRDGIILTHVRDNNLRPEAEESTDYMFRSSSQAKLADLVTYDKDGNIIPLSERFNPEQKDIRYSIDEDFLNEGANDEQLPSTNSELIPGARYTLDATARKPKYKPQGMGPRAREVQVPERAKTGDRVSDFVRSFMESDKASDEIVAELQQKVEDGDWGAYTQLTNEEAMDRAKKYISQRQITQAQHEFHDMVMSGKYNVHTRALGLQLLTEAASRGDKMAVLDIATDLRILATDAGQSVQIFATLKKLGGVGSAWYMQRLVDRLNSKYADQIAEGEMDTIVLDEQLMQQLMEAKTTKEVTAAEKAISKNLADQLPLTWADRLSNWRYMAMLANPTTHVRNMFGNLLMAGLNKAKDTVATGIERVGVKNQADRAHAVLTSADRKTWGNWAQQSFEENEENLRGGGKLGFETFVKQNMRSFDTKWLNAIAQFNFNALENEDLTFIRPAYKNALMQYMKAQGYTMQNGKAGKMVNGEFQALTQKEMNKAVEWASNQAWKATFRDASALATMLNKISKMNVASKLIVEGVMPFKRTPINIAKRGVEYSPVGIIMGTVQMMRDVRKGKVTAAQAIDNIASGITGTALMVIGMFLAKAGVIRAGGDDKKKKETYLQDTGDQTYSLKIGNFSINLSALAPATIPLFMGVALQEAISRNDEELDLSAVTDTIAGTLNPFMEMSFMSSLNSALKNYGDEGIGGALGNTLLTSAENYFSQYLPTVVGKVGQFADKTVRTTKSSATSPIGSGMDYYVRSLMKKIPGVEATLQPDVNVWGRTTEKDAFFKWVLDFANKFVLPANVKVSNRDAVDDELIRLVESTGNVDMLPSDGQKKFIVKGTDYPMTAAQYTQYSMDRGQASYAALKEVMGSTAYQQASDEARADMLTNALKAAQKQVDTMWKEKLGALEPRQAKTAETGAPAVAKDIQGDYSDPELYQVASQYPNAYDKAAKAKSQGVPPSTFLGIYEKRYAYIGDEKAAYTRREIMNSDLTPKQKELMDDLIVSDKGWNPDYSSREWFEVSMLGKDAYDEAKTGAKVGLKPETYLAAYKKNKEISAAKLGKDRKPTVLKYLDSLSISAPEYDYLLLAVFGIKSRK